MVTFNLEKFTRVLKRFAEHLRDFNEIKAAEAVETIIKALKLYVVK